MILPYRIQYFKKKKKSNVDLVKSKFMLIIDYIEGHKITWLMIQQRWYKTKHILAYFKNMFAERTDSNPLK